MPDASDAAIRALGRGPTDAKQIELLRNVAQRNRPPGYVDVVTPIRERYEGLGLADAEAEKRRRFPETHDQLPTVVLDTTKQVAKTDAQAYRSPPTRTVVDDDAKTEALAELVAEIQLDQRLLSATRRAQAAGSVWLKPQWDPARGRIVVDVRWPDQVMWHCQPGLPASADSLILVIASASAPDSDADPEEDFHEVWHRSAEIGDDGMPVFGGWRAEIVGTETGSRPLYGDGVYPLDRCPWVPLIDDDDGSTLSPHPGHALLQWARNSEAIWLNVLSRDDYHGSPATYFFGQGTDALRDQPITVGPGRGIILPPEVQQQTEAPEVSTVGLDIASAYARYMAAQRRQSPSAYDAETGAPESGAARRIANREQDAASEERRAELAAWEASYLLPVLAEVSDYWGETSFGEVAFGVEFPPTDDYSDPQADFELVDGYRARGYITKARAAVMLGLYPDEATAEAEMPGAAAEGGPEGEIPGLLDALAEGE